MAMSQGWTYKVLNISLSISHVDKLHSGWELHDCLLKYLEQIE